MQQFRKTDKCISDLSYVVDDVTDDLQMCEKQVIRPVDFCAVVNCVVKKVYLVGQWYTKAIPAHKEVE